MVDDQETLDLSRVEENPREMLGPENTGEEAWSRADWANEAAKSAASMGRLELCLTSSKPSGEKKKDSPSRSRCFRVRATHLQKKSKI